MSSAAVMIKIGGCMMMFSMIASLTGEFLTDQPFLRLIIGGILEMTSGLSLIPDLAGPAAPYFVLAFISFGGLSVAAQSFSAGQLSSGEQIRYLIWKTIQSAITLGLWAVLQSAAHK